MGLINTLKKNRRTIILTILATFLSFIAYMAYLLLIGIPQTQQYLAS